VPGNSAKEESHAAGIKQFHRRRLNSDFLPFDPHIWGVINDYQVRVAKFGAKFGAKFDWHTHRNEDEGFLVLQGKISLDCRDGSVQLREGEFLVIPRGAEHRSRSLTEEPIVLTCEPNSTVNTAMRKAI